MKAYPSIPTPISPATARDTTPRDDLGDHLDCRHQPKADPGGRGVPRVDLVAVASRDRARAEDYAREWGIERAYGSYDALLEDGDVEAVYISLPNTMHCEWSIRALEAGKHVLCEKPMSRHPEEVEAAFDAADQAGRHLSEAFMYRHNPQTKRLRQLIEEGAVGEVRARALGVQLLALRRRQHPAAHRPRGRLVDGRRLLLRQRLTPCSGKGAGLRLRSGLGRRDGDRLGVHGAMRFDGDVLATFDCGTALPERDELEVIGSEGSLFLDDPWHCNVPVIEVRRGKEVERIELDRADSYRLELENVGDAIDGKAQLLLGREDAVGQARALEALHRSAESGQAVRL